MGIGDFFKGMFGSPVEGKGPEKKTRIRSEVKTDPVKLGSLGLPVLEDKAQVASWLGLTVGQLGWFITDMSKHYTIVKIKKPGGATRTVRAPKRRLKAIQRKINSEILFKHIPGPCAHGFVTGRSIMTNAANHVRKTMVAKYDIKHFFDSIRLKQVVWVFMKFGYSSEASLVLARLCCAEGRVRQGFPTSPSLSNAVCERLDRRMSGLAVKFGCTYTRYADDMTFSGGEEFARNIARLNYFVEEIVGDEGFRLNDEKTCMTRRGWCQVVTGLAVNDKVNIPRAKRREWRAMIFNFFSKGTKPTREYGEPVKKPEQHVKGVMAYAVQVAGANTTKDTM